MPEKVDFIYLGPPKSASTWIFQCLSEHPGVCAPHKDEIYYFDQYHAYGEDWYHGHFKQSNGLRIDCTPTYIYSREALERILRYNPDIKLAFTLRNPVDRAFSAYWHIRKRNDAVWRFEDIFNAHPPYRLFLAPGLFADNIRWLSAHARPGHITFFRFEDLKAERHQSLQKLFSFLGIDEQFSPPSLEARVNVSGPKSGLLSRAMNKSLRLVLGSEAMEKPLFQKLAGKGEYVEGVPAELRTKLLEICEPDIAQLEDTLDIDLSDWRKVA